MGKKKKHKKAITDQSRETRHPQSLPKPPKHKLTFVEKATLWTDRHAVPLLAAILLLGLLVRIAALLGWSNSIYSDYLLWDEKIYHTWATKIANGTFQSSAAYEMAPFPAYLMAFIYWLFSPNIIYIRIINIVFGILTCWLIYLIGKELVNRPAGLLACLIACLYKPFIFYSIVPLKTTLAVTLFTLAIWLLISIMSRNSLRKALFLGIAVGLVFNVRPNAGILIPFLPLIILWTMYREKKPIAIMATTLIVYILGISAVLSPFMIRNYLVTGGKATATTTSQAGFNLYICNNLEKSYPFPFAITSPNEQGIQFTIEASRRVGRKLSSTEASAYWRNEVIRSVLQNPFAYLKKYILKTIRFLGRVEHDDHYHIGFMSHIVPFFKLPFFAFWFVLPLGMAGMLMTLWRSRKSFAMLSVFLLYASTLIVFFSNGRVRLLLLSILIPMAAIGLMELYSYIKKKQFKRVWIFLGIVILFSVVEFWPREDRGHMTAYYNTHAIVLNAKGFKKEAIRYWEASSNKKGHYSPFANLALAEVYIARGNIKKALSYLDKIDDTSFAAASKYEVMGDIAVREDQIEKAVNSYERAITINSGLRAPRLKLIRVLEKIDPGRAAEEQEKLKYINSFYNVY